MTDLPDAPKKIIANLDELHIHSSQYAKEYGEGLPELELLLNYCFDKKFKVVYCSKGKENCWAYIYFAGNASEISTFKIVVRNLLAENIAGFNYEIRAKANYLSTEKLRGVIFRCKHYAAGKMFDKIAFSLQNHNAFSNRDVVDKFNSIISNFEMRGKKTDNLSLIYDSYRSVKEEDMQPGNIKPEKDMNVIKFFEIPLTKNGHNITYNGKLQLLSSLSNATSIEDLKGIYQVDMDLADFNTNVLKKIFK